MTEPTADPRFYDFDAAFAEQQPIPFKLLGETWQLPPTVPAKTILRVQRLMLLLGRLEADDAEIPDDMVLDDDLSYERMCRDMVGDEVMDTWLDRGISYDMLAAVTRRLYAIHTGGDPDEEQQAGPTKAAKRPQDRKPKQSARRPL